MLAEEVDWFIGTSFLLNSQFPIIFHSSEGSEELENENSSFSNSIEADIVMKYVQDLQMKKWNGKEVYAQDIGIITPYASQRELMKAICRRNAWDKITIGTVETFQGQEKDIIIVSTVRTHNLGFLIDPRVNRKKLVNISMN